MKKIIFLLLLAQTISFLYADSNCIGYKQVQGQQGVDSDKDDPLAWRWGIKAPKPIKCYCNCAQYKQAHGKCLGCGHIHLPTALKLSDDKPKKTIVTIKTKPVKKTHRKKKATTKKVCKTICTQQQI